MRKSGIIDGKTKAPPSFRPESLRFAQEFVSELKGGQLTKDRLPLPDKGGVPFGSEEGVRERGEIFRAVLDLDADLCGEMSCDEKGI